MKEFLKSNIDETPSMIIMGVVILYVLVAGFIWYLMFLHRISMLCAVISTIVFTLIYLPRFLIIKKIVKKDDVKIIENFIMINGLGIDFADIQAFRVEESKPQIVFFINNKMIAFYHAKFYLKLRTEEVSFNIIGSEKIRLLKEFLSQLVS